MRVSLRLFQCLELGVEHYRHSEYSAVLVLHLVSEVLLFLDSPLTVFFRQGIPVGVEVFAVFDWLLTVDGREVFVELAVQVCAKDNQNEDQNCHD